MLTGALQLNDRVEILGVGSFPEAVRQRLSGSDSDYILSERGSRLRSQRVNSETAAFLRQFETPCRVVDAVLNHVTVYGGDPEVVLEDAYPLVSKLHAHGLLIAASETGEAASSNSLLSTGQPFGPYRIGRRIRALTDTEVYSASAADGREVAVKIVRQDAPEYVHQALAHETEILAWAQDRGIACVPRLLGEDLDSTTPSIVMEWREGVDAETLAHGDSMSWAERGRSALAVIEAYASLHTAGLLHGDVQPNNILIDGAGRVSLVDFGGASLHRLGRKAPRRLALLHYAEPAVALAHLNQHPVPAPSTDGEQYAVAVIAYQLATGQPYLLLPLEADAAMHRILEAAPRPFEELGFSWPAVEDVLARALSKRPEDRHEDLSHFAGRLARAIERQPVPIANQEWPQRRSGGTVRHGTIPGVASAADDLISRYGLQSSLIRTGLSRGPRASVYYGAAGIAYALLRHACVRSSADSLASADVWIRWALSIRDSPTAFVGNEIGLTADKVGPASVLNAESGLYVVLALISYARGDDEACREAVAQFIVCVRQLLPADEALRPTSPFPSDLANGVVGLLQGASLLLPIRKALPHPALDALLDTGRDLQTLAERELAMTDESPEGSNPFLGFAHGRAGALFAMLSWMRAAGERSPAIRSRLHELAGRAHEHEGCLVWPLRREPGAEWGWPGWCHGSAGHLLLWSLASEIVGGDEFTALAEEAAGHVWTARRQAQPSLCCGLAGMALSLLVHGTVSGQDMWVDRGRELSAMALDMDASGPHHSLFRGELGVLLAAVESLSTGTPRWPMCSPAL